MFEVEGAALLQKQILFATSKRRTARAENPFLRRCAAKISWSGAMGEILMPTSESRGAMSDLWCPMGENQVPTGESGLSTYYLIKIGA
ncbi:hypothetical protein [Solibacillus sp. CAU 1738]|uniref:hypothetical protein n=1 Tax=Solibacillus sp. CAU 1738 TaxID=3140363 RepID=UPI003260160C